MYYSRNQPDLTFNESEQASTIIKQYGKKRPKEKNNKVKRASAR